MLTKNPDGSWRIVDDDRHDLTPHASVSGIENEQRALNALQHGERVRQQREALLAAAALNPRALEPDGSDPAMQERAEQIAGRSLADGLGPLAAHLPPALTPTFAQLDQIRAAVKRRENYSASILNQTVTLSGTTAGTGGPVSGGGRSLPAPRRLVVSAGLNAEIVEISGWAGPKFGATSAEDPTPEGQTKPEADSITPTSLAPQALSRWTDMTVQALMSTSLTDIAAWHALGIAKDEDALVIGKLLTEAGTPIAYNSDVQANTRGAMARVEDAVSAQCDVLICNPSDVDLFAATTPANGSDVGSTVVRFAGAIVYPSSALTAGTVLVAALRAVGKYGYTGPATVSTTLAPKSNTVTVLTEMFTDFAVRLAGGVVAVDVAA